MKGPRKSALAIAVSLVAIACDEASPPEVGDATCELGPVCAAAGEGCGAGAKCCPGLACDGETGACGTPACRAEGESCANSVACCAGAVCVNAICTPGCHGDFFCISLGQVCQFGEQCCGGHGCWPDGEGGTLRCAASKPTGATCSGADDRSCCVGTSCGWSEACGSWRCVPTTGVLCRANGTSCTSGVECCSAVCYDGRCRTSCKPVGQDCAVDADCCSGSCDVPDGATGGTCACTSDMVISAQAR